jgi:hypothetical protein
MLISDLSGYWNTLGFLCNARLVLLVISDILTAVPKDLESRMCEKQRQSMQKGARMKVQKVVTEEMSVVVDGVDGADG